MLFGDEQNGGIAITVSHVCMYWEIHIVDCSAQADVYSSCVTVRHVVMVKP